MLLLFFNNDRQEGLEMIRNEEKWDRKMKQAGHKLLRSHQSEQMC